MIQSDGDSDYRSAGVMVWNFLPGFIRLEIVVLTSGRIRLECSKPDDEAGWIGGQSGNFLIPRCIDSMAKRGNCVSMFAIKRRWQLAWWICMGVAILLLDYFTGPNIAISYGSVHHGAFGS